MCINATLFAFWVVPIEAITHSHRFLYLNQQLNTLLVKNQGVLVHIEIIIPENAEELCMIAVINMPDKNRSIGCLMPPIKERTISLLQNLTCYCSLGLVRQIKYQDQ